MRKQYYEISPRGFGNEKILYFATTEEERALLFDYHARLEARNPSAWIHRRMARNLSTISHQKFLDAVQWVKSYYRAASGFDLVDQRTGAYNARILNLPDYDE